MAKKTKKVNGFLVFAVYLAAFVVGTLGGAFYKTTTLDDYEIPAAETYSPASTGKIDVKVIKEKDLSIHFIELGNKYTGDCTLIKAGDTEVLIDAGSRAASVTPIYEYIAPLIDGKLDYAVVTHAHQDHYAGFATSANTNSIFDLLETQTVIKFANTNQKESGTLYSNFNRELKETQEKNGTKVYDALECWNKENGASRVYNLSDTVEMEILYQKYYAKGAKASSENDYSVCLKINRKVEGETFSYLFTGDLEKDGEKSLVAENKDLGKCVLYKAGHHGSKTSSSDELLSVIKPDIVCVCACAGSIEYTTKNENTFPTQIFINNVAKYTDEVYVTTLCVDYKNGKFESMNGNIVIASSKNSKTVEKYFSASDLKLKDTDWFKNSRLCPDAWKS